MHLLKSPRDLGAGIVYILLGAYALWIGSDYTFRTASGRMGAGYFPVIVASCLILIGTVSMLRAFLQSGEPLGAVRWTSVAIIIGGTCLFAWLLPRAGAPISMLVTLVLTSTASRMFRLDKATIWVVAGMTAFCTALFIYGLGVPMPLLGSFFTG